MKFMLAASVFVIIFSSSLSAPIGTTANETQCLTTQVLPHHEGLVEYPTVSGVSRLRRTELNILYRATLELESSISFLMLKLSCRTGEAFPPPHHHCFLEDRNDPATFLYNSTELFMHAQRLAADLCLLVPFITPLHSAICYEQTNHAGAYAPQMMDIEARFGAILEAISNVTGVPLPAEEQTTTGSEGVDEDVTLHPDQSGNPSVSGSPHRDTRQIDNGLPSPPPVTSVPGDSSDRDLLNQGQARRRRQAPVNEPTESSEDRCSFPQSDQDQFIYIYELYQGIWYTVSDLRVMTSGQ